MTPERLSYLMQENLLRGECSATRDELHWIFTQLAIETKRAEATEAETAARMIVWLEGLEPDDMPDSATVLERLKRGDWRAVDICPTCRGVSGNGSGYCAAWHGGQHLDKTEVKP